VLWVLLRPLLAITPWGRAARYRKELARLRSCGIEESEAQDIARELAFGYWSKH
jgi:hypothetical protein